MARFLFRFLKAFFHFLYVHDIDEIEGRIERCANISQIKYALIWKVGFLECTFVTFHTISGTNTFTVQIGNQCGCCCIEFVNKDGTTY